MPPRRQALLDKALLVSLYFEAKFSLAEVARRTGTPTSLVRDSFRKHGLKWRSRSEAAKQLPPKSDVTRAKMSRARTGFKDTPEVAARKRAVLATCGGWGWNKGLTAETDPRVARQRKAAVAVMQTRAWREARSRQKADQIASGKYYARGYYDSQKAGRVYYMSGWELRRWQDLDQDSLVVTYLVQPCRIPYEWEGPRTYVPDVLITYQDGTKILEEIKPQKIVAAGLAAQGQLARKLAVGAEHAVAQGWGWRVFSYPGR